MLALTTARDLAQHTGQTVAGPKDKPIRRSGVEDMNAPVPAA
jgi:hypothetical protein